MIRGVLVWKYRGAGPLISLPDYVHSFRAMEPSSSSLAQQQQRNHGGSINSVTAGAKLKKGSFGGVGSAFQNSSSHCRNLSPPVNIQFGTVGVSDNNPKYATESLSNDFPQLSEAHVFTLQTATTSLDGEQLGNGSKLKPKDSLLPLEGRSAMVQNTKSQVMPTRPSQWPSERPPSRPVQANNDRVPATDSPSIDYGQFPPLSVSSAAGNRKGRGRGTAEQVQTRLPREPQELEQAVGVDSATSVQTGPERERQRNSNQSGQGIDHNIRKVGHRKGAEMRIGQEFGDGRDPAWEKTRSIDTLGRALTRILRHQADDFKLKMSSDGYVDVHDILKLSMKTASNRPLSSHSIADVKQAVQKDKKQRFGIKDENGRLFIRANQGHSLEAVKSEHLLKPIVSADEVPVCVHGTYRKHLDLIFKEGLKRMHRNHVHFAAGVPGSEAVISGMRSTSEVLIYLNVNKALADGMKLYISENNVILTNGFEGVVPPEYFKEVLSVPDMKPIAPEAGPA